MKIKRSPSSALKAPKKWKISNLIVWPYKSLFPCPLTINDDNNYELLKHIDMYMHKHCWGISAHEHTMNKWINVVFIYF